MKRNVLVIGGAGYIGSHTVVELSNAGYKAAILDNFCNSDFETIARIEHLTKQGIKYFKFDFSNSKELRKIINQEKITSVIHFAAFKAVAESVSNPLEYYSNNVAKFITLLSTLENESIKKMVFSSSAAVYGEPTSKMVDETSTCMPASPYGWSKYIDEIILKDLCNADLKFSTIALRYFNVVGAHSSGKLGELSRGKPQNLMPIIIQSLLDKKHPMKVYGDDYPTKDGSCERDYIHVVDLAKAHVAALNKLYRLKTGSYEIYNIGTGKPTSVFELIASFEKVNNVKVKYNIGKRRPGDPSAIYASVAKANTGLGWKATKNINDAALDAWRWQQYVNNAEG